MSRTPARERALFREVNERIREVVENMDRVAGPVVDPSSRAEFICECSNPDCTDRVELSLDEYKEFRSSPVLFVIKPGHETLAVERVVERKTHCTLVEKIVQVAVVKDDHEPAVSGGTG